MWAAGPPRHLPPAAAGAQRRPHSIRWASLMARMLVLITLPLLVAVVVPPARALPDAAVQGAAAGAAISLLDEGETVLPFGWYA